MNVKSSKQKRGEIEAKQRKAEQWRRTLAQRAAERQRLHDYKIALARDEVPVITSQLAPSNSYSTPDFVERGTYRPEPFVCKDCGGRRCSRNGGTRPPRATCLPRPCVAVPAAPKSAHARPPRAVCIWKDSPGSFPPREGRACVTDKQQARLERRARGTEFVRGAFTLPVATTGATWNPRGCGQCVARRERFAAGSVRQFDALQRARGEATSQGRNQQEGAADEA